MSDLCARKDCGHEASDHRTEVMPICLVCFFRFDDVVMAVRWWNPISVIRWARYTFTRPPLSHRHRFEAQS